MADPSIPIQMKRRHLQEVQVGTGVMWSLKTLFLLFIHLILTNSSGLDGIKAKEFVLNLCVVITSIFE